MQFNKVAIASDHGGLEFKNELLAYLKDTGIGVVDIGPFKLDPEDDYPDYAHKLCHAILEEEGIAGILVCGTGIGMNIAANKVKGIRCAHCHDVTSARFSREHNDANVVALGARILGLLAAKDIIDMFLATPFNGGRHERRVKKIHAVEE